MCQEVCEHRKNSNRTYVIIIVILFVIMGVLAVLVAQLTYRVNGAYDLSRTNHVIVCNIDTSVNGGQNIYECRDVPAEKVGK